MHFEEINLFEKIPPLLSGEEVRGLACLRRG